MRKRRTIERATVALLVDDLRVGGAQRQLVELAKGLDKSRFRALVVTLHAGGPLERELIHQEGVELVCLHRGGKYDFAVMLPLAQLLRRRRVQVVMPFLTPATFFALAAAALARTPVRIATERSGIEKLKRLGEKLYRAAEDALTGLADVAVANSEAGRSYLMSRGIKREKTRVIYNGIAAERVTASGEERLEARRALGIDEDAPLAGMVATLTPQKDWPVFLWAADIVRRSLPEARFLIVGDGPLRGELERQAATLGLGEAVVFAGQRDAVAPLIGALDVAVLSSCDHEGCSNYLLEAMGLSKPVVATDIGGNRELVREGETGLLAPVGEPQALAEAMLKMLSEPQTAARMGAAGRARFEDGFSVPVMAGNYERLYEELLSKKGIAVRGAAKVAPAKAKAAAPRRKAPRRKAKAPTRADEPAAERRRSSAA
jgi:glycosyltransferase involved in cell wall biosynthesis